MPRFRVAKQHARHGLSARRCAALVFCVAQIADEHHSARDLATVGVEAVLVSVLDDFEALVEREIHGEATEHQAIPDHRS
jgi:hypothetical protein